MSTFINCTVVDENTVLCNDTKYKSGGDETLSYDDAWFWIYVGIYAALVIFAGKNLQL